MRFPVLVHWKQTIRRKFVKFAGLLLLLSTIVSATASIAERLSAENIPARAGRWHATSMSRVLKATAQSAAECNRH